MEVVQYIFKVAWTGLVLDVASCTMAWKPALHILA